MKSIEQYNKKGGVPIAITLLVLATLLLTSFSLVYFAKKSTTNNKKIYSNGISEEVYSKAMLLDFYTQEITDKAAKKTISSGDISKENFIDNFNNELNRYKLENGKFIIEELAQIENRLNQDNVIIQDKNNGKEFSVTFDISIYKEISDNGKIKKPVSINYTYTKAFTSKI